MRANAVRAHEHSGWGGALAASPLWRGSAGLHQQQKKARSWAEMQLPAVTQVTLSTSELHLPQMLVLWTPCLNEPFPVCVSVTCMEFHLFEFPPGECRPFLTEPRFCPTCLGDNVRWQSHTSCLLESGICSRFLMQSMQHVNVVGGGFPTILGIQKLRWEKVTELTSSGEIIWVQAVGLVTVCYTLNKELGSGPERAPRFWSLVIAEASVLTSSILLHPPQPSFI